jgi:class 3 adenylate cyclase/tetratricopeptide (TPR) repeat protein
LNCGQGLAAAPNPAAAATAPAVKESTQSLAHESRLHQFIPRELLARLESARGSAALEGERRVVTMLFCDVKGSTAAASQLDPEEWAEIINLAFERMIRPVYQYEGTVARLTGDGLLAFFGAPIAHEDDPQRAVLAGLEIVQAIQEYRAEVARRWGIDFAVRVGINTGLVVVGAVGSDLRMEYTALGDAINLAARMEQTAQPGTVQVAEATYKLVAPLFDFETITALEVKGRGEPVQAYRALGPKAAPGRLRGIAGLDAPLVGRDREREALQAAIGDLRAGRGQIISLLGEAGLGKSRLLAELRKAALDDGQTTKDGTGPLSPFDPQPASLLWLEGRSLSFERSTPYAPFIALLTDCFGLASEPDDAGKYLQVKNRVAALLPERAGEIVPFLATLLEIPPTGDDLEKVKFLEPPQLRSLIFNAVSAFLEQLAAAQPLALVLDDVHWIDPTSLDLLEFMLPLADRAAVLIIAAYRPRRQELSWRFHETAEREWAHRYTAISLQPLDESESRMLLGSLLHIEDLPEKVRRLILERAEGNPFFVEELIRSLLDAGLVVRQEGHWRATRAIENLAIPNTLNGVITSRLDRLEEGARQIAQAAAVIGRDFSYEVLADIVTLPAGLEAGLAELQRRELIREKSRLPRRAFLFKHILTQEAAYASILLSRRRELHGQVAESLERREPEAAAGIARHFLEARQPGRAAPYLVAAGERAARAYSNVEASEFFAKVLELGPIVADRQLLRRAYEGLGSVLAFTNQIPQAIENYERMLALGEQEDDMPMQVSALNKLAAITGLRLGNFPEAERYLARSDRLAHAHDVPDGIVEMSIVRCQMCTAVADFDSLNHYMGEVIEIGRALGVKEHMAMGLEHVAGSLMFLTRFDESWEKGQAGMQVAREIGDREHEAWLLIQTFAFYHIARGDLEAASAAAEEGVQIAARIGSLMPQVYGNWALGEIARWRGEYEQALVYGQRALEVALPVEEIMPFLTVQPLGSLGLAYLEISGHFTDPVARFHRHALKLLENPAGMMGGGTAWADLGFCALACNDLQAAEESFQKGLNYPTMFMNIERPRYLLGSALVALARGQLEHAQQLAAEARSYIEERRMRHLEPLIALGSAQILAAQGNAEAALAEFKRAEATALGMQMRPIVWQARAGSAGVMAELGRGRESQAERQAARDTVAEIAGMFRDEQLRSDFLRNALPKAG